MTKIFGKSHLRWLFLFVLFLVTAGPANSQITPPVPLPVPFTPVVDNAHVVDAATRQRLETIWTNLKQRADIEFAVVTVPTTDDKDIFDFSLEIARGWGIGAKDGDKAGLLLVVAIQDRKYFTQVSRHLEGELPDGVVGQIQRERLVTAFRQSNYSKGILDTIQAYVATLADKRGFSVEGIDQSYAYRGRARERETPVRERPSNSIGTCCGILVVLFLLMMLFSAANRRGGGGGSGCLQALLWGSVFSNLGGGNRWGSGWSGGGFGGGGGGFGGGGFGGGFGGGGDFGGGGAGGSW